jgi:hypothetical protein
MSIDELYRELVEAYSDENLNRITRNLILLYKRKDYGTIREIANKISKYMPVEEDKDAKCFSSLIMLYHPDKGVQFRKTIRELYERNDYEDLYRHSHILTIQGTDIPAFSTAIDEDVDYQPEYAWDVAESKGFSYPDQEEDGDTQETFTYGPDPAAYERSFYNLIKIREYGDVSVEFPAYYLEDFEEFELAGNGLESLDGVEHCLHVRILDVSNNELSDLSNLWDLAGLEELYLANNQIGYIDALNNLVNLKILDLSGNRINDLSPILDLEHLEFVNITGNPVPPAQINMLRDNGVIVIAA